MARRSQARRRRRRGIGLPTFSVPPEVARSLLGLTLLVLGVVMLIMLFLPAEEGTLTRWARDLVVPFFGSGRWLLPFLLLGAGAYIEWNGALEPGWQWRLIAGAVAYVALLGVLEFLPERGGGRIGTALADALRGPLQDPVAFVVLAGVLVGSLLVALQRPLRSLVEPFTRPIGGVASVLSARAEEGLRARARAGANGSAGNGRGGSIRSGRGPRVAVGPGSPGQRGLWGRGEDEEEEVEDEDEDYEEEEDEALPIPSAVPSNVPTSATFAPLRGSPGAASATLLAAPPRSYRDPDDVTDAGDAAEPRIEYELPPLDLLEDIEAPTAPGGEEAAHRRNEEIIVRKLAGFNIPAQVVNRNAGPVVTQYEVQPAPDIKVSRIEALADDLAMALAARSLRIEAPIPGKSAVGIEIPNKEFNIVALRRILEEVDFKASGSTLTFALGRDVAGKAQAVDLAKMPHLLIAGATGSGKSVMVNALITSLLCEATPHDVRMILMDLKRVELASYNGLPHLLVPVITEPERAKAALKWAVNEMESRYRRFAGANARNIRAYNDARADPEDRLPFIVIIVDELADLMMREGKNVEEPIVRLAQKARATGIHLVLATQRPSVNVVTGLIKANFPSRIAFAMASQIDSRTILDAPGAEDLIGRGDMLYQPSDLPRPMRLQGVFVSDPEILRVVDHWREQIDDPHYDLSIIESDEDGTGSIDDLVDDDADRLLPDAVDVIREYDRASASLLQRRLKIGYARAARIIDQLEERGYIGAFDGSNARPVLRREAGSAGGAEDDEDDDE
ncbi:MAG TPA: DNA translocase FtsK [Candidatus Limnocylindrales bacterium]|nr:DNA translocase FtsK [Candidatus Limnocylindrales bacterium]